MKRFITWLYVKYVFIPGLRQAQEEDGTDSYFLVERCDPHWDELAKLEYEKHFSTIH